MYRVKNTDPEFDDLVITGEHSILRKTLGKKEWHRKKIDDMYMVIANTIEDPDIVDLIKDSKIYHIYHVVLESKDLLENYGIWANGILSESLPLKNAAKMTKY